jgi:hypothetical protein
MVDFDKLDLMIREGRLRESRRILRKVRISEIARVSMVRFAGLARRAGLAPISVRLLNPVVRPDRNLVKPANENELAEYAASLTNIGARTEALGILDSLNPKKNPEIFLFRAFNHISVWSYSKAISDLKNYISTQIVPYQKLVGRVNLAAALVHESETNEAEALLNQLIAETKGRAFSRLHANALELRAQLNIERLKFIEAEKDLDQASELLKEAGALDEFFIMKWRTILKTRGKATPSKLEGLKILKQEASRRNHWETVRDSDFYLARFTRDWDLFCKLYHGTPHESFRKRIRKHLSDVRAVPESYDWLIFNDRKSSKMFDVKGDMGPDSNLKVGLVLHRLVSALTSDFYRPTRTAALFSILFSEEYYNPVTSPHRVHQNILRLRSGFNSLKLPLEVAATRYGYKLVATKPITIRTHLEGQTSRVQHIFSDIQKQFGEDLFKTSDLMASTGLSKRTVLRLLEEARLLGLIEVAQGGRSTRYRLANQ